MHKRILCAMLAALMLFSLIPVLALPSRAASNMKTSERCIAILKQMEGFIKYPMKDNTQYSVGYGSGCDPDDYPNGITEEEADALLREYLVDMEKALNDLANREGILFSQNQFDALLLFTYNCGTMWTYGDGEFRQAVVDGDMGNTLIFHITQWSFSGTQMLEGLINRRLIEADMYLNGSYTNVRPSNYLYLLYDNNGGSGPVKLQGFDCNLPGSVKALPSREGYRFLGWYTAAEGGTWTTEISPALAGQTLYAHWQPESATAESAAAASYQIPADRLDGLNFYNAPGGKSRGKLNENAMASITAEYVTEKGVKWGKLPNGCWVRLGDPRIGTFDESDEIVGVKVTVTGDYVNVRTGPGTDYNAVSAVLEEDEVVVVETRIVDGTLWGRIRGGWICLDYTDYKGGLTPTQPGEDEPLPETNREDVLLYGVVKVNGLNIRATAGTHGYLKGCYAYGDEVKIVERVLVGGTPWGRTDLGWICLNYVDLSETKPEESTEPSEPEESTTPEETKPSGSEETTKPSEPEENQKPSGTTSPATPQGIPGTVISKTGLNIRSGAGTHHGVVGGYHRGDKIIILEQCTVAGVNWGRTDRGWVSMQYVQLQESWETDSGIYGTVISTGPLNIRSGAGVSNARVGTYNRGDRIVIYEQVVVSGQKWGRTEKGWVCMTYVELTQAVAESPKQEPAPETTVPETTVPENTSPETEPETDSRQEVNSGTVTAGGLNVRSKPGISGAIVGSYTRGDRVEILERTLVNGVVWGKTVKGWINLNYVQLDPVSDGSSLVTYVTADLLCIRKGAGTGNPVVGTYSRGDAVVILEVTKIGAISWGRTDLGWICMNYVN